jgi:hypothetical protein
MVLTYATQDTEELFGPIVKVILVHAGYFITRTS